MKGKRKRGTQQDSVGGDEAAKGIVVPSGEVGRGSGPESIESIEPK